MPLPPSFAKDGFLGPSEIRGKFKLKNGRYLKPLMLGTEGESDTGKTEFFMSAPGPGQAIIVDRQLGPTLDNKKPPATRRPDWGFKVVTAPLHSTPGTKAGAATIEEYGKYFRDIRDSFYSALLNPDSPSVVIDGDSDFWELHILAKFGKVTGIYPQTQYGAPYAERRAITARAHDSGKIIIATNKLKDEYETVLKADGTVEKDDMGEDKRRKTGEKKRQGFPDTSYLWNIQLRHLYRPATEKKPQGWGIRILKCKANMELVGEQLWDSDCNFRSLVELVYPEVDPRDWGFDL